MRKIALLFAFPLLLASCVVQAPKYTHVEQVLSLKLGMDKAAVSKTLGIPPYDLKSLNDTAEVLIYKYRVTDRKTVPLFKKETNGIKATGAYVDLLVTYNPEGKVVALETCSKCSNTEEKVSRVDFDKVITLLTVTVPALLVYLGITLQ